jgi:hypothetical protein
MKMTNAELIGFFAALGTLKQRKMPARLAWKLSASEKLLRPFADAFDSSTEGLRKRFAEKNEDGSPRMISSPDGTTAYDITPENMTAANRELTELMNESFSVEPVELTLSDFPDNLEVTPELMGLLAPLMEADKDAKQGRK